MTSLINIDELHRSKRKTLSLMIDRQARLIVKAPIKMPLAVIHSFILQKEKWINKKQTEILDKFSIVKDKEFVEGELFYYMGKQYPLFINPEASFALHFDGEKFILNPKFNKHGREIFKLWYTLQAKRVIINRASELSKNMHLPVANIRISHASRRWGSCSAKKNLNFSWRLMLAPSEIIDYIIIHELAHTLQMNHSEKYWGIVEKLMPDYREHEKWLRKNSFLLNI